MDRYLRYRVNVSTSTKGVHTYDCTVEGVGYNEAAILRLSRSLVKELDSDYPLPEDAAGWVYVDPSKAPRKAT